MPAFDPVRPVDARTPDRVVLGARHARGSARGGRPPTRPARKAARVIGWR
ncbi:hypothetical protein APASM_3061 [Actinosynnema pretiosum subsp. pretiosum]|nr:hypothetical protein APASM_3061 [Actinosynnema pretiosum subsp. pretiosum]